MRPAYKITPAMHEFETLAALDLGSNSFHLQIGRVEGEQLFYLDSHKEAVRLAAGLDQQKRLDRDSQQRALDCLARFAERIKGMDPKSVRAVGTSALRVAKNSAEFLALAQATLGFGIEVVAGREEARLIYLGVAHSLPLNRRPRLVVDIGGGSTECIIGTGYQARQRESLRMGCVGYTRQFFADGRLTRAAMQAAETAARLEIQAVAGQFRADGGGNWQEAVGSSGSARALGEICRSHGHSDGEITLDGLVWMSERLIRTGSLARLNLEGLKPDRLPVLPGGLTVMLALFRELGIERMTVAQGAMREGILWDLLGRVHDHDMRDVTANQFQKRYRVDMKQAHRVEDLALRLAMGLVPSVDEDALRFLAWAARLHEIGLSIAHSGLHKHAAYILENADMPGFSRGDQGRLASLVRASRGSLSKLLPLPDSGLWPLVLCLRLAVLLSASRTDDLPESVRLTCRKGKCSLHVPAGWMRQNPLSRAALEEELLGWRNCPQTLCLGAVKAD